MFVTNNQSTHQSGKPEDLNRIGFIDVDVTISEKIEYITDVTDKTVEDGTTISDNIIIKPTILTVECVLVNGENGLSMYDKLEQIEALRLEREPFEVLTSIGTFSNMAFKGSFTVNRNKSNSQAIVFNATLKEVITVESKIRFVPKESVSKENEPVEGGDRQRSQTEDKGKTPTKETKKSSAAVTLFGLGK